MRANGARPAWPRACSQGGGRFLRLLADVPRFHRAGRKLLAEGSAHGSDDALSTGPDAAGPAARLTLLTT